MRSNELMWELTATGDLPVQLDGYSAASYVVRSMDWDSQAPVDLPDTPATATATDIV